MILRGSARRHTTCTPLVGNELRLGLWTLTTSGAHDSTRQSARLCRLAQIALRERESGTRRARRHRVLGGRAEWWGELDRPRRYRSSSAERDALPSRFRISWTDDSRRNASEHGDLQELSMVLSVGVTREPARTRRVAGVG